jgi:hypothetical protein
MFYGFQFMATALREMESRGNDRQHDTAVITPPTGWEQTVVLNALSYAKFNLLPFSSEAFVVPSTEQSVKLKYTQLLRHRCFR